MGEKEEKKMGVDECMDIISCAEGVVDDLVKHKANDGAIDRSEYLKTLAHNAPAGVKALWGSWKVPAEIADIDPEEAKKLLELGLPVLLNLIKMVASVSKSEEEGT